MRLKLIAQWRSFWRMWSLRLNAVGLAILGYITVSPEIISQAWYALPPDIKTMLPPNFLMWISVALFALGIVARLIKQESIPKAPLDGTTEHNFEKP